MKLSIVATLSCSPICRRVLRPCEFGRLEPGQRRLRNRPGQGRLPDDSLQVAVEITERETKQHRYTIVGRIYAR